MAVWLKGGEKFARELLHEQHLACALDGTIQPALIVRGKAGVLSRQDPSLICHKLLQQVDVFEIERVDGKIDFGLGARGAGFTVGAGAVAAFVLIWPSFARHS